MCEIDNKKDVEGVIGELRNDINKNVEKLLGYIMKNEKGTFPLPDETVSMLSFHLFTSSQFWQECCFRR